MLASRSPQVDNSFRARFGSSRSGVTARIASVLTPAGQPRMFVRLKRPKRKYATPGGRSRRSAIRPYGQSKPRPKAQIVKSHYVIKSIASVSHSRNKRSVIALGTNEPCPCVAQTYPIVLANLAGTLAIGLGRSGRKGLCWCVHESQAVGL
jgi:hypothetical protein